MSHNRFQLALVFTLVLCGCLLPSFPAVAQSAAVKTVSTNQTAFGIPFRINADNGTFIEVQLYFSTDRGRTWKFLRRQATNQPEFPFRAAGDGEYWFSLKTLDRNRQLLPPGKPQPELKIIVDTKRPTLDFRIESDRAGRVACRWDARDAFLNMKSFKIFYRADAVTDPADPQARWREVPIQLDQSPVNGRFADQIAWWPETTSEKLTVRITIADQAGNLTYADRQIVVPQITWRNKSQSTARLNDQPRRDTVAPNQSASSPQAGKVVCQDGVCRIDKSPTDANTEESQRFANSDWTQSSAKPTQAVGSPSAQKQSPHTASPTNSSSASANNASGNHAAGKTEQPTSSPPGERVQSIAWPSQTPKSNEKKTTAVGSTQKSDDQSLATGVPHVPLETITVPDAPSRVANERTAQAPPARPSPESQSQIQGDHFVSESTTRKRTPAFLNRANKLQRRAGPKVFAGGSGNAPNLPFAGSDSDNGSGSANNRNPGSPALQTRSSPSDYRAYRVNQNAIAADPGAAQPINSRRFQLNYSVDAIDPSGVQRVDLWMTRDLGRTWTNWGTDPDAVSPFPVEVDEQGVYGFRVVIQSRDGLTGRPPRRGDRPDMLVQVDTQAPRVHIASVPYGRGQEAGRLIINWQASDPLLVLRPITLAYSTSPSGPWSVIERGLRNNGRYAWKVGAEVPERIFLRIEAIDRAGNIGVYQLPNPIDISGLVPRAHIQSVQPVGASRG